METKFHLPIAVRFETNQRSRSFQFFSSSSSSSSFSSSSSSSPSLLHFNGRSLQFHFSLSLPLLYIASIIRHSTTAYLIFLFSLSSPYSFSLFSISTTWRGFLFHFDHCSRRFLQVCCFVISLLCCRLMPLSSGNASYMILDCLFQDRRSSLDLRLWFRCHFRASDVTIGGFISFRFLEMFFP